MTRLEALIEEKGTWLDELDFTLFEGTSGNVMTVYVLDGVDIKGKPAEMMIRSAAMPWVVEVFEKGRAHDFGLPYGGGEVADRLKGRYFEKLDDVLEEISKTGLDHVFYLGHVSHEVVMAGVLFRRKLL